MLTTSGVGYKLWAAPRAPPQSRHTVAGGAHCDCGEARCALRAGITKEHGIAPRRILPGRQRLQREDRVSKRALSPAWRKGGDPTAAAPPAPLRLLRTLGVVHRTLAERTCTRGLRENAYEGTNGHCKGDTSAAVGHPRELDLVRVSAGVLTSSPRSPWSRTLELVRGHQWQLQGRHLRGMFPTRVWSRSGVRRSSSQLAMIPSTTLGSPVTLPSPIASLGACAWQPLTPRIAAVWVKKKRPLPKSAPASPRAATEAFP